LFKYNLLFLFENTDVNLFCSMIVPSISEMLHFMRMHLIPNDIELVNINNVNEMLNKYFNTTIDHIGHADLIRVKEYLEEQVSKVIPYDRTIKSLTKTHHVPNFKNAQVLQFKQYDTITFDKLSCDLTFSDSNKTLLSRMFWMRSHPLYETEHIHTVFYEDLMTLEYLSELDRKIELFEEELKNLKISPMLIEQQFYGSKISFQERKQLKSSKKKQTLKHILKFLKNYKKTVQSKSNYGEFLKKTIQNKKQFVLSNFKVQNYKNISFIDAHNKRISYKHLTGNIEYLDYDLTNRFESTRVENYEDVNAPDEVLQNIKSNSNSLANTINSLWKHFGVLNVNLVERETHYIKDNLKHISEKLLQITSDKYYKETQKNFMATFKNDDNKINKYNEYLRTVTITSFMLILLTLKKHSDLFDVNFRINHKQCQQYFALKGFPDRTSKNDDVDEKTQKDLMTYMSSVLYVLYKDSDSKFSKIKDIKKKLKQVCEVILDIKLELSKALTTLKPLSTSSKDTSVALKQTFVNFKPNWNQIHNSKLQTLVSSQKPLTPKGCCFQDLDNKYSFYNHDTIKESKIPLQYSFNKAVEALRVQQTVQKKNKIVLIEQLLHVKSNIVPLRNAFTQSTPLTLKASFVDSSAPKQFDEQNINKLNTFINTNIHLFTPHLQDMCRILSNGFNTIVGEVKDNELLPWKVLNRHNNTTLLRMNDLIHAHVTDFHEGPCLNVINELRTLLNEDQTKTNAHLHTNNFLANRLPLALSEIIHCNSEDTVLSEIGEFFVADENKEFLDVIKTIKPYRYTNYLIFTQDVAGDRDIYTSNTKCLSLSMLFVLTFCVEILERMATALSIDLDTEYPTFDDNKYAPFLMESSRIENIMNNIAKYLREDEDTDVMKNTCKLVHMLLRNLCEFVHTKHDEQAVDLKQKMDLVREKHKMKKLANFDGMSNEERLLRSRLKDIGFDTENNNFDKDVFSEEAPVSDDTQDDWRQEYEGENADGGRDD